MTWPIPTTGTQARPGMQMQIRAVTKTGHCRDHQFHPRIRQRLAPSINRLTAMRPIPIKEAERILPLMSDLGGLQIEGTLLRPEVPTGGGGLRLSVEFDRSSAGVGPGISHAAIGTARYLWRTSGEYASTPLPGSVQLSLGGAPGIDPRMPKIPARGCFSGRVWLSDGCGSRCA